MSHDAVTVLHHHPGRLELTYEADDDVAEWTELGALAYAVAADLTDRAVLEQVFAIIDRAVRQQVRDRAYLEADTDDSSTARLARLLQCALGDCDPAVLPGWVWLHWTTKEAFAGRAGRESLRALRGVFVHVAGAVLNATGAAGERMDADTRKPYDSSAGGSAGDDAG
jgi:hypothetical protein